MDLLVNHKRRGAVSFESMGTLWWMTAARFWGSGFLTLLPYGDVKMIRNDWRATWLFSRGRALITTVCSPWLAGTAHGMDWKLRPLHSRADPVSVWRPGPTI